jgi:PAS domain S-box-containing protein
MRQQEIKRLADSTAEPAFVTDGNGLIVGWNEAAAELFGLTAADVLGRPCGDVVAGTDECGAVCSEHCVVQQTLGLRRPLPGFDMQVATQRGRRWCNFSVLSAHEDRSVKPYAIHLVRLADWQKRLDALLRDFVRRESANADKPAQTVVLTPRERQILCLSAQGLTTNRIAAQLFISPVTVNNHFQHILTKLDAHTRLTAIRRAEHAGLI